MLFLSIVIGMIMTLVVYCAYIFLIAFTLWMVVDAGKQDRFWWVVLVIGVPVIGAAAYYFTEKKHEYAKAESHHVHTSQTEQEHEKAPHKVAHHHKDTEIKHEESAVEEKVA